MKKKFSLMSIMLAIILCFVTLNTCVADEDVCIEHSWKGGKAATCTDNGNRICTICGTVEIISATGHTWKNGKAATCTESGNRICTNCGAVETIPSTGHTWKNGKAVTCTEDGNRLCETCGVVETIPAIGHTWKNGQPATCTEDGNRLCETCGAVETIAATGHTEEFIPGKAATCTQTGLTDGTQCSVCGTILVEQKEILATGHTYKTVTHAPTESSRGYQEHTCKICRYSYRDHFTPKIGSEKSVPVSTATPVPTGTAPFDYGSIVFDINDITMTYQVEQESGAIVEGEQGEKLLNIIAMPNEDGTYSLRKLYCSFALLDTFRGEKLDSILFLVGDTKLVIPMSMFDDEVLGFILADNQDKATGYVFVLNPYAEDENGNSGCQVAAYIRTSEGDTEITSVLSGMILNYNGSEFAVDGSAIYQN